MQDLTKVYNFNKIDKTINKGKIILNIINLIKYKNIKYLARFIILNKTKIIKKLTKYIKLIKIITIFKVFE